MDVFSLPPIFVDSNEPIDYVTQVLETNDITQVEEIMEELFGESKLFLVVHPDRHVGIFSLWYIHPLNEYGELATGIVRGKIQTFHNEIVKIKVGFLYKNDAFLFKLIWSDNDSNS